jgi:peptide/nickel transport system ATP-binding protein
MLAEELGALLLRAEDLYVHFKAFFETGLIREEQVVRAVDGVSVTIGRGEILGLVGESGSGKTTLGRACVGLVKPTAGKIVLEDKTVANRNQRDRKRLWKDVQMIFQDPYSSFNPLDSVHDALRIALRRFDIVPNSGLEDAVRRSLTHVGLDYDDLLGKYPNQLSGGQRQRLAIARALVVEPKLIVADEPVSMLDVSLRAGILDLMNQLNQELGLSILFITHDLAVAEYISQRIAVMYKGKIVELAPARELIQTPLHPYTELLLASVPRLRNGQDWSESQDSQIRNIKNSHFNGCQFYPKCPLAVDKCTQSAPKLVEVNKDHFVACYERS